MGPVSCKRTQERLSDYVDGDLGPLARLAARFHLRHCEACRKTFDSLEQTLRLLREVGRRREAARGDDEDGSRSAD